MTLTEKQQSLIRDLQDQEQMCIQKYDKYAEQAKDPELKRLFGILRDEEQEHYDSLEQCLSGNCPDTPCKTSMSANYNPVATYTGSYNDADKTHDEFLCTDCISTEKYVSGEYNCDLFQFGDEKMRNLFNHIQTEEQNHAEMIYKYKVANNMAQAC